MNISIGDKFVAITDVNAFCLKENDVVEVTNVDETTVTFIFNNNNFELKGMMSAHLFEKYFVKLVMHETHTFMFDRIRDNVEEIIDNSEFERFVVFDTCAVVSCQLPNGFIITETFNFANTKDRNEEFGFDCCAEKILDKIWELEEYRLREKIYENCEECEECECPCDCEKCPCDEESDYEDEDVDCDNCADYNCPDNPHYNS